MIYTENGKAYKVWIDKLGNYCVTIDGRNYNWCPECDRLGHLPEEC